MKRIIDSQIHPRDRIIYCHFSVSLFLKFLISYSYSLIVPSFSSICLSRVCLRSSIVVDILSYFLLECDVCDSLLSRVAMTSFLCFSWSKSDWYYSNVLLNFVSVVSTIILHCPFCAANYFCNF